MNKVRKTSAGNSNSDSNDDSIDPDQFAKILELLTNPKLKKILKPEIADALEDNLSVLNTEPDTEAVRTRVKSGRVRVPRPKTMEQPRAIKGNRRIPPNRQNRFTASLIPRIRPVGNLENIAENGFVADKGEDSVDLDLDLPEDNLVSSTETIHEIVTQPPPVQIEIPEENRQESSSGRSPGRFKLLKRPPGLRKPIFRRRRPQLNEPAVDTESTKVKAKFKSH